jgi:hypothetical protein
MTSFMDDPLPSQTTNLNVGVCCRVGKLSLGVMSEYASQEVFLCNVQVLLKISMKHFYY